MTEEMERDAQGFSTDKAIAKVEKRIVGLRDTNGKMMTALQQVGVGMELGQARVDKLTEWLVEQGIITYAQRLEEEERWQMHLREQLKPPYEQLKTQARLAGVPMQTAGGLIVPGDANFSKR